MFKLHMGDMTIEEHDAKFLSLLGVLNTYQPLAPNVATYEQHHDGLALIACINNLSPQLECYIENKVFVAKDIQTKNGIFYKKNSKYYIYIYITYSIFPSLFLQNPFYHFFLYNGISST